MRTALPGTWEMIRAEQNGETAPELVALGVLLELSTDRYEVRFAGRIADRGTWAPLEAAGAAFQLTGTEGPNRGRTIPCIYQLVGDRLRVCYGLDGRLPLAFKAGAGSPCYLATYRRRGPESSESTTAT